MVILFAHRWDELALNFADKHPEEVQLFTCKDLSSEGWKVNYQRFELSEICIKGKVIPVSEITGLISLAACISPQELIHINDLDKDYVAAEMNAFLAYFFGQLQCKKINEPVIGSFLGCSWRHEKWLSIAHKCGFHTLPFTRRNYTNGAVEFDYSNLEIKTVKQLGKKVLNKDLNSSLLSKLEALQQLSGLTYQEIKYSSYKNKTCFVSALPNLDLSDELATKAVLSYFKN